VQVSISFGGASWTINPADMNLGTLNGGTIGAGEQCVGGIFDIGQVTNAPTGGGNPNWIIGDTFLVCNQFFPV
jgi:cathepsin D